MKNLIDRDLENARLYKPNLKTPLEVPNDRRRRWPSIGFWLLGIAFWIYFGVIVWRWVTG